MEGYSRFVAWAIRAGARHHVAVDVGFALGLYALLVGDAVLDHRPVWPGVVLGSVIPASALLLRRRYPLLVLAVTAAYTVATAVFSEEMFPESIAVLIALYGVGRNHPLRVGVPLTIVIMVGWYLLEDYIDHHPGFSLHDLLHLGWVPCAYAAGAWVRVSRALIVAAEDRAERLVTEERLRIARDLHDVLGHSVMSINVQAGVAARLLDRNPAGARQSLDGIRTASGDALEEIRAVLGLLRADDDASPMSPQPGLADIEKLANGSGLPTTFSLVRRQRHPPADVSELVAVTAYRIVQEALTNVGKHGRNVTAVRVELTLDDAALTVEVADDGSAPGGVPVPGLGLRGMAERVATVGGSLSTGPASAGFLVRAVLPVRVEEET